MTAAAAFAGVARPNRAYAASEVQTTPPAMTLPIVVSKALKSQGELISDPSLCSVSGAIAAKVGVGAQLRVRRNGSQYAVYTVHEVRPQDDANEIRLSYAGRQRLGTTNTFSGSLRPALCTSKLSDSEAKSSSEFIECLADSGYHQGLVVLAPHGGGIELNTDRQARRVLQALSGGDVSSWCCKGWRAGGGSWDRWHVTSTAIHPDSFPGLASIADRNFAYSVSFHGMSGEGILIGGGGPYQLKQAIRQAIKDELSVNIPISIAGKYNSLGGTSSNNVTNWITAGGGGGIQLEQSYLVRSKYWRDVADAVANVFAGLV